MANAAWARLAKILSSKKIWIRTKVSILQTFILPVIAYGCETWNLDEKELRPLNVWWNDKCRCIYGVRREDEIELEVIYKKLKIKTLGTLLKRRKAGYFAHTLRQNRSHLARALMNSCLHHPKKVGRGDNLLKSYARLAHEMQITNAEIKNEIKCRDKVYRIIYKVGSLKSR